VSEDKYSLTVERGTFGYRGARPVFSDVSFSVESGDVLTILGANGAGKSTLLNCIAGFLPLGGGRVLVDGADIRRYGMTELARRMAYVPQVQPTAFDYTVRDYVVMGRAPYISLIRTPGREDYCKVDTVLDRMGLAHLRNASCKEISGGERQQVQIARALVQESRILLMDEPTNHLDYGNQLRVLRTIRELAAQGHIVVQTTHVPDHATLLDGIAGIMRPGAGLSVGSATEVVTEHNLSEIYDADLRVVYVEELRRMACLAGSIHHN
jgi:iron complex transport system ATP-binding protein